MKTCYPGHTDWNTTEQEPMRDDILELLDGEKPTLLQRKTTGERILRRIIDFVETFINGISG